MINSGKTLGNQIILTKTQFKTIQDMKLLKLNLKTHNFSCSPTDPMLPFDGIFGIKPIYLDEKLGAKIR